MAPTQGHFARQMAGDAICVPNSSKSPLECTAGDTRGTAPPPFRIGRVGGRARGVTMARVAPQGGGFQVRMGLRIPPAPGTFTGRPWRADNGPGQRLIAARRPSPSAAGGGGASSGPGPPTPGRPPAPGRPAPPPPAASSRASSPRPRGPPARRGRRKGLVGWPRRRHARPSPGKQRGDV